ncbi:MAG TPA: hypothetical protein VJ992_12140 [Gemmatimonadales bacterium]|jgi:hypothetical protein|nr:hypothetical protein [Gemmatimonadales bacterium]
MKVDFAVACDYALVDQYGKLSVLGIFQHIWVAQFPALHPRLHLVLRLRGKRVEVGDHAVLIRLIDEEDGSEILSGGGTVTFQEPPAGVLDIEAGTVLAFDVPFQHPGRFHFEISVDGVPATLVPITVAQSHHPTSSELH